MQSILPAAVLYVPLEGVCSAAFGEGERSAEGVKIGEREQAGALVGRRVAPWRGRYSRFAQSARA